MTLAFRIAQSPATNSTRIVLESGDALLVDTSQNKPFKPFSIENKPDIGATISLSYTQDPPTAADAYFAPHAVGQITGPRGFFEESPYKALKVEITGGGGTVWVSAPNYDPKITEL